MSVIKVSKPIQGSGTGAPLRKAGAPVGGAGAVADVQTITGTATGGAGPLSFNGASTPAEAFNASAATIQADLQALPTIGAGNVTCTGGPLGTAAVVCTFGGPLGGPQNPITVGAGFTGGVVTVAHTTAGIAADGNEPATGALLIDTTNALLYQNTGTPAAPVWTKVGTET